MTTTLKWATENIEDTHKINDAFHRMIQRFDPLGKVGGSKTDKLSPILSERYKVAQAKAGEVCPWLRCYVLFGSHTFVGQRGWHGMINSFNYIDEAKAAAEGDDKLLWTQIVDIATGRLVWIGNHFGEWIWEEISDDSKPESL